MSEVRNGDKIIMQKYIFSKMFYGRQEVHKYLSYPEIFLFFLLILMAGSRSIHYSLFASHVMCHLLHRLRAYGCCILSEIRFFALKRKKEQVRCWIKVRTFFSCEDNNSVSVQYNGGLSSTLFC